ncbi:hypothetical protein TorRG33x02_183310 [Trema orientale]|uniref:Uncharacterized protein n=1 Tax=Trema orientale TaxID=63057 RepID=A0A2P5EJY2_TREOI|nr:hypothetical protein TorRG33x02_183310 [Trema orientale]
MKITLENVEQLSESQNDSEECAEIQASIAISQSLFPHKTDNDNMERLEYTTTDIEERSSTIPQPQLAKLLDTKCPEIPVEA